MNKKELRKVIRAIKLTPDKEFNMGTWFECGPHCQTVGCAIGNYCRQYPDSNLRLTLSKSSYFDEETALYNPVCGNSSRALDGQIRYEYEGFDAVEQFFELSSEDADYLFNPDSYNRPSKKNVIARIQKFIDTDE